MRMVRNDIRMYTVEEGMLCQSKMATVCLCVKETLPLLFTNWIFPFYFGMSGLAVSNLSNVSHFV